MFLKRKLFSFLFLFWKKTKIWSTLSGVLRLISKRLSLTECSKIARGIFSDQTKNLHRWLQWVIREKFIGRTNGKEYASFVLLLHTPKRSISCERSSDDCWNKYIPIFLMEQNHRALDSVNVRKTVVCLFAPHLHFDEKNPSIQLNQRRHGRNIYPQKALSQTRSTHFRRMEFERLFCTRQK